MIKRPPGPKGNFLIGSIAAFSQDQAGFLVDAVKQYGDLVYFRLLNYPIYLCGHPDHVREVLVTQSRKFEKAALDKQILGKFLGNGLLISDGDFHKRQRRLAQPAFHSQRIQAYAGVMVAYTQRLLTEWETGQVRAIDEDMMRLTMMIVSKTLFDADAVTAAGNTAETIGNAMHDLQAISNLEYRHGFSMPNWIPTPNNQKRKRAVAAFKATMEKIIAGRRDTAVNGVIADTGDLLSMLMLSQDEDGSTMDDRQLLDEVATLFAAGHETTSNALTWTWYLLAQHPEVRARLEAELDHVLAGRTPTLSYLPQLTYTGMVIKESMRLYPPAWILNGRDALEDAEVGDYIIPKGSTVLISPYVMHRLPQYFPDPERFDPERFTPEKEQALPRYAYMPFGGGPRICIGNAFAMMEAQLLLATIAQRYRLTLAPDQKVVPATQITMSPKYGLHMQVGAREPADRPTAKDKVVAETD